MSKWKQKGRYKKEYSFIKEERARRTRRKEELKRLKEIQRRARALEDSNLSILKNIRKPTEDAPIIREDVIKDKMEYDDKFFSNTGIITS